MAPAEETVAAPTPQTGILGLFLWGPQAEEVMSRETGALSPAGKSAGNLRGPLRSEQRVCLPAKGHVSPPRRPPRARPPR